MVGQLLLLQVWVSVSFNVPSLVTESKKISCVVHNAPPEAGKGLSHSLILDCRPPPQLDEQLFQLSQGPHAPSTKGSKIKQKQVAF